VLSGKSVISMVETSFRKSGWRVPVNGTERKVLAGGDWCGSRREIDGMTRGKRLESPAKHAKRNWGGRDAVSDSSASVRRSRRHRDPLDSESKAPVTSRRV